MENFSIEDMVRYQDPLTAETIALQQQIVDAENALAAAVVTSSVSNFNTRMALAQTRDELRLELQPLLLADYGAALASVRYFAIKDEIEMPLPISGLKEKFECFITDLENYEGEDANMFTRSKIKMRHFIIASLVESKFLSFDKPTDFIIEK
jgi:hypothetical protein